MVCTIVGRVRRAVMEGRTLGRTMLLVSALAVAFGTSAPGAAQAHDTPSSVAAAHARPLTGVALTHERRLRAIETAVLGRAHAAEHARLRGYERNPYWRAKLRRAAK